MGQKPIALYIFRIAISYTEETLEFALMVNLSV